MGLRTSYITAIFVVLFVVIFVVEVNGARRTLDEVAAVEIFKEVDVVARLEETPTVEDLLKMATIVHPEVGLERRAYGPRTQTAFLPVTQLQVLCNLPTIPQTIKRPTTRRKEIRFNLVVRNGSTPLHSNHADPTFLDLLLRQLCPALALLYQHYLQRPKNQIRNQTRSNDSITS